MRHEHDWPTNHNARSSPVLPLSLATHNGKCVSQRSIQKKDAQTTTATSSAVVYALDLDRNKNGILHPLQFNWGWMENGNLNSANRREWSRRGQPLPSIKGTPFLTLFSLFIQYPRVYSLPSYCFHIHEVYFASRQWHHRRNHQERAPRRLWRRSKPCALVISLYLGNFYEVNLRFNPKISKIYELY